MKLSQSTLVNCNLMSRKFSSAYYALFLRISLKTVMKTIYSKLKYKKLLKGNILFSLIHNKRTKIYNLLQYI